MRPCQHCGAALPNHVRVCTECGQPQRPAVGLDAPPPQPAPPIEEEANRFASEADGGLGVVYAGMATIFVFFTGMGALAFGVPGVIGGMFLSAFLLVACGVMCDGSLWS